MIRQIAQKEELNTATVRRIFKSAELIMADCFASAAPAEEVTIRPFQGISLRRNYVRKKTYSKGMFQNVDCPEHVTVKANLSKYYIGQLNQKLFEK